MARPKFGQVTSLLQAFLYDFPSGPILASDPVRVNKSDAKIRPYRRLLAYKFFFIEISHRESSHYGSFQQVLSSVK